jgi:hypothetical protein
MTVPVCATALTTPKTRPRLAEGTAVVSSANHDALYAVSAAPVTKLIA